MLRFKSSLTSLVTVAMLAAGVGVGVAANAASAHDATSHHGRHKAARTLSSVHHQSKPTNVYPKSWVCTTSTHKCTGAVTGDTVTMQTSIVTGEIQNFAIKGGSQPPVGGTTPSWWPVTGTATSNMVLVTITTIATPFKCTATHLTTPCAHLKYTFSLPVDNVRIYAMTLGVYHTSYQNHCGTANSAAKLCSFRASPMRVQAGDKLSFLTPTDHDSYTTISTTTRRLTIKNPNSYTGVVSPTPASTHPACANPYGCGAFAITTNGPTTSITWELYFLLYGSREHGDGWSFFMTFTVIKPSVTSITPTVGKKNGGTTITIKGHTLGKTTSVTVDGTTIPLATITVVSTTEIQFKAPAHSGGKVTVVVSASGSKATPVSFTYATKPLPTSITPTKGLITGGTTVTIHGSNFSTPTLAITFGTTPATTITVISTTEITVKTPAHSAGYVTVHFKNAASKETSTLTFDFVPPTPTVSSVTPTSGSVHGGTTITLHGTNLGHGTVTVTVGGVAATTVVVVGTTEITFKLPANSGGSATIVVKNTNGTSIGFSFTYTWTAPTVSSLTTKTGPVVGGTLVTIHGSNFLATTLEVLFGTTVGLTVTAISTTTLTVRTPKHAVGTVTVTVSTSVNKVNAGVFRYTSTGMVAGQRVAATPTGDGWWEATPDGGVRAYGNANFYGSLPAFDISVSDIVAIVGTLDGKGYYLVGNDGGVFAFGDAYWRGSLPASGYSVNNIVYMALTPDGAGYYLVGSDGGVFAFGDAYGRGSLPNNGVKVSNIIGMAVTPDGAGYYIVGSDGGVFAFGDAYWRGSLPSMGYDVSNVLGIAVSHSGKGYYLAASDGGVFGFGDAWFYGSLGGATLESPIDGLIVLPSGDYNIANNNGVVSTFHSYPVPGETEILAKPAHAHAHVVHTKRRAYLRRHSQLAGRRR